MSQFLLEEIRVNLYEFEDVHDWDSNTIVDHVIDELRPVNEHNARCVLPQRNQGVFGECRCGDENPFRRLLLGKRACELIDFWTPDRLIRPALRLYIDVVKSQLVLANHSVNSAVSGLAKRFPGLL
jgi:hypothetical protein